MGVYVNLPIDYPLDHPDLHPLWQAMDEDGLCYIHHSFSEGYPGYRDLWRNPFLGRTASHPWGAMRAMGAFFGAGLLDRYPNLRFAVLESGFGWIPFWAVRMEDQAELHGLRGRGPAAHDAGVHERRSLLRLDRPARGRQDGQAGLGLPRRSPPHVQHGLSASRDALPGSVDLALGWPEVTPDLMRKILWDNAVKAFGEP